MGGRIEPTCKTQDKSGVVRTVQLRRSKPVDWWGAQKTHRWSMRGCDRGLLVRGEGDGLDCAGASDNL